MKERIDENLYRGFKYAKIINTGFNRYFTEDLEQ